MEKKITGRIFYENDYDNLWGWIVTVIYIAIGIISIISIWSVIKEMDSHKWLLWVGLTAIIFILLLVLSYRKPDVLYIDEEKLIFNSKRIFIKDIKFFKEDLYYTPLRNEYNNPRKIQLKLAIYSKTRFFPYLIPVENFSHEEYVEILSLLKKYNVKRG